jgi:hypothetical protein
MTKSDTDKLLVKGFTFEKENFQAESKYGTGLPDDLF